MFFLTRFFPFHFKSNLRIESNDLDDVINLTLKLLKTRVVFNLNKIGNKITFSPGIILVSKDQNSFFRTMKGIKYGGKPYNIPKILQIIKVACQFKKNKNVIDVEISYDFLILINLTLCVIFVTIIAILDLNYLNWRNLQILFYWGLTVIAIPYFGLPFHFKFLLKKQFSKT